MLGLLMLTKSEKEKLEHIIEILNKEEEINEISYQILEVLGENSEDLIELIELIFENLDEMYEVIVEKPIKIERKIFQYNNTFYLVQKKYFKSTITYIFRKLLPSEKIKKINIIK